MENIIFNLDVEFASESEDLPTVPFGYIDKTICGCGLTTLAIEKGKNCIIAVPSIPLVENKGAQYPNSRYPHKLFPVTGEVSPEAIYEYSETVEDVKIIVTYDSLHKVEWLLEKRCRLIIDESDKMLSYKKMKAQSKKTAEQPDVIKYMIDLAEKHKETVSFISATPIPLEYLPQWVSEINQVKINWKNTIKAQPILMQRKLPFRSLANEIIKPLKKEGAVTIGGATFKKVIVFMNSVQNIVNIIKECELGREEVACVIGGSLKNDLEIKGYDRLKDPSNLPRYTFVTAAGFNGIDLIDDSAISIVVSNYSRGHYLIDISTDLKQAISRQRNKTNPNYSKYIFIYNQTIFHQSENELISDLDRQYVSMGQAAKIWLNSKEGNLEDGFNFLKINNHKFSSYFNYDAISNSYIIDDDMFKADKYHIIEVRRTYEKGFDIKGTVGFSQIVNEPKVVHQVSWKEMVRAANRGENIDQFKFKKEYYNPIKKSINYFGKAWEDYTYTRNMVNSIGDQYSQLNITIHNSFKTGHAYTRNHVKLTLKKIYGDMGISRTPQYSHIKGFFIIGEKTIKGVRYVEIIRRINREKKPIIFLLKR